MDTKVKQRLCLLACPLNSNELGGGFVMRHFNYWTAKVVGAAVLRNCFLEVLLP